MTLVSPLPPAGMWGGPQRSKRHFSTVFKCFSSGYSQGWPCNPGSGVTAPRFWDLQSCHLVLQGCWLVGWLAGWWVFADGQSGHAVLWGLASLPAPHTFASTACRLHHDLFQMRPWEGLSSEPLSLSGMKSLNLCAMVRSLVLLKRTSLPSARSNGIFWALTAESRAGGRPAGWCFPAQAPPPSFLI